MKKFNARKLRAAFRSIIAVSRKLTAAYLESTSPFSAEGQGFTPESIINSGVPPATATITFRNAQEENEDFAATGYIAVPEVTTEDHASHLQVHLRYCRTKAFLALPREVRAAMRRHCAQHELLKGYIDRPLAVRQAVLRMPLKALRSRCAALRRRRKT